MKEKNSERVDKLLVDQKLARSRTQAQALVMAGQVCVGDLLVKKPSELFQRQTVFRLKESALPRFVSRGGEKLDGALTKIDLNVEGFKVLDIGMSTGGFTDCLLQREVAEVFGIDVGHNQADWKIRNNPRVKVLEGVNARELPPSILAEAFDMVVIDVSFISLSLILPEAIKPLKEDGCLLALIKPQFEVEKGEVGKGGIVKDPLLHERVQVKIKSVCEKLKLHKLILFESSIEGKDGNKEFFIFGRR